VTGDFALPLLIFAGVSLVTAVLPLVTKPPEDRRVDHA
jgi:hypothetical protein